MGKWSLGWHDSRARDVSFSSPSGGCLFTLRALGLRCAELLILLVKERRQLAFDKPRILPFENSERALEHHFLDDHSLTIVEFQLCRRGKKEDVRRTDAINRGYKRDRDSFTDLVDVVEVLHVARTEKQISVLVRAVRKKPRDTSVNRNVRMALGQAQIMAEESANLTKFNILNQSGLASLAQANQVSASVLALLR